MDDGRPRANPPVVAVIPVKVLNAAKSRLALPDELRQDLALGFALDVIAAALSCPPVDDVVVVTDDVQVRRATAAWPVYRLPDPFPASLSAAVDAGCAWVRRTWPGATTLVVPADLPALTGDDLARAVHSAAGHSAAFARDATGSGTTLLLREAASDVRGRYGVGSAAEHERQGCVDLADVPAAVRQDVDTLPDLLVARSLGVGSNTRAAIGRLQLALTTGPAASEMVNGPLLLASITGGSGVRT